MITALLGFAVLLALCFYGFRVGFATLLVGFVGFALERGWSASLTMVAQQVTEDAQNYNLSVIPLFVLMGVFIYRSDISRDLYDAAYAALGKFRGGLALATVLACGGFSAVCGSTLATAATMSKVAMPQMKAYNYSDRLAAGTIAAGGTLGIMIPPSVPLVIYGIVAEQDIGLLFIAGILPGMLLVLLFLLAVVVTVRIDPASAPAAADLDQERKRNAIRGTLPVLILFTVVLGGIYGGVFTATEASGIGAFGAAVIAVIRGHLRSIGALRVCLVEAATTTAKIFIVLFGAVVFTQFINMSGMPYDLLDFVDDAQFSPTELVAFICLIALLMGMVFETIGIVVLLVPVFLPALYATGVDMIWFGIIVVLVTEIGLITPPIGMNVFVVKSVLPRVKLTDIFRGVTTYIVALGIGLITVFAVPQIATFLPSIAR
ncbi:tripartite ATP-independent transporter DctM subunit [Labrenzia sp. EL_208]|uniref:TRAP transporter large permease n=1 Tax=Roseibium album TaxID=311410 RepID=UPI0018CAFBB9|nr:TRAP transporter large permease [Roseibium album]MBG6159152.1 tripartite ATP-independent transporter DctM subunit [Labrenzia sp. EL_162]MBG6165250.1 tripartite ATP-independent transporter DctM subunit [Labrenzia sp. EL_195]MBG6177516.1 tripartite ATP-independent transporter DctM subunit [Labrenzia sp. EL_132]MBG6197760.1 tripartite ATP-independent transporter DctM subunit [Labrenzia sp. EL_159]MBG6208036.1 tripartite ATP-independent transporter DctM subunit [Labrenzia sp. EL_126]MBG6232138